MKVLVAWLPAVAIAALIFYLSSIPGLALTEGLPELILRKGAHLTVYGLLALAALRGLRFHGLAGRVALAGALALAVLYAVSDELHQSTVPQRHGSPVDVLIDTVGAGAALLAAGRSRRLVRVVTA